MLQHKDLGPAAAFLLAVKPGRYDPCIIDNNKIGLVSTEPAVSEISFDSAKLYYNSSGDSYKLTRAEKSRIIKLIVLP